MVWLNLYHNFKAIKFKLKQVGTQGHKERALALMSAHFFLRFQVSIWVVPKGSPQWWCFYDRYILDAKKILSH